MSSRLETRHRGAETTVESYRGIPVDAASGVHAAVAEILNKHVPLGGRVADLGAGRGALSLRLHDAGYQVVAFDLDPSDWGATEVSCYPANLDSGLGLVAQQGPFKAVVAIEVIEHLENPRAFLRGLLDVAATSDATIVVSAPNPLDTFSTLSFFRRGTFNWFSRAHYTGGGHISILPYWLIEEHLLYLGVDRNRLSWTFWAPWNHPKAVFRGLYRVVGALRALVTSKAEPAYVEGQTALLVIAPQALS